MSHVLSQNAKLYYNTGTYAAPTWSEIGLVRDLTLNLEKSEVDVTVRNAQGWMEFDDGLKDASLSYSLLWDSTDAAFTAIQDSYYNNTDIEMLVLDGPEGTIGSSGIRMTCMTRGFSRNENFNDALWCDVVQRPAKNADSVPEKYVDTGP